MKNEAAATTRTGKPIVLPAPCTSFEAWVAGTATPQGPEVAFMHVAATSQGYTRQDHYDAHRVVYAAAREAKAAGNWDRAYQLGAVAGAHRHVARNWAQRVRLLRNS